MIEKQIKYGTDDSYNEANYQFDQSNTYRYNDDHYFQDDKQNNFRGRYHRARGRGRGGYKKFRGSKNQINGDKPYYQNKQNKDYSSRAESFKLDDNNHNYYHNKPSNRGWRGKARVYHQSNRNGNKEPSIPKSNEEVDTISTLSEYIAKPKLIDKDVESKASYNEWESETVPLTLSPRKADKPQSKSKLSTETQKEESKSQLNTSRTPTFVATISTSNTHLAASKSFKSAATSKLPAASLCIKLTIKLESFDLHKTINAECVRDEPKDAQSVRAVDANGDVVVLKVDLDRIAQEICQQAKIDMKREIKCYLIEMVQSAASKSKALR